MDKFQSDSCSKLSIWVQMKKGRCLESLRPVVTMVGLEGRSQVDEMFVGGGDFPFNLPPEIKIYLELFSGITPF